MKINVNHLSGPLAVLLSGCALFFAIGNTRTTETAQQTQPTKHAVQQGIDSSHSQALEVQLQELNASLAQTRELLVALQTRQLKLEQFTKKHLATADSRSEIEPFERSIAVAAKPSQASVDHEALNKRDQHLNYLEDVLYEQELDPTWSLEMSDKINGALSAIPGNLADGSFVQCQSTLCMVELTVNNEEADEFVLQFNTQIADATQQMRSFVHNRGDGKLTMQMYLTKAGHDLPNYSPGQSMP